MINRGSYQPRIVDSELTSALNRSGAVLIQGPRACGKTETALQVAQSVVRFDREPAMVELARIDPQLVLQGENPRLLDEWQLAPQLWNLIRGEVDDRKRQGLFILTGSTAGSLDSVKHTGAGRFTSLRMRGMTLSETGHSSNEVSFASLIKGEPPRTTDFGLTYTEILDRVVKGGWPGFQSLTSADASRNLQDYLTTVAEIDLREIDNVNRDPLRVRRLISALARSTATEVSLSTLAKDETSLSRDTVRDYLAALQRIFLVEDLPAWSTHLRSSATLRKGPKRHFVDPSLAVAALGSNTEALLNEPRFAGQLFESLVVQHLRVFGQSHNAMVTHARDSTGKEIDAVVQLPNGTWSGFEMKLSSDPEVLNQAAQNMLAFAQQIEERPPTSLNIVVPVGVSYQRADTVNVIAISSLGP